MGSRLRGKAVRCVFHPTKLAMAEMLVIADAPVVGQALPAEIVYVMPVCVACCCRGQVELHEDVKYLAAVWQADRQRRYVVERRN